MGLLELIGQAYGTLLFLRFLLPGEGQVGYNRAYRFLVRMTEPVLAPLRRGLGPRGDRVAAPIALGLIILLLGLFSAGADYHRGRMLALGPVSWTFSPAAFWWLGRSLGGFAVFLYRAVAFLLVLAWLWQGSLSPLGRLVRAFAVRLGPARVQPGWRLAAWAGAFSLFLLGFRILAEALGWLSPGPPGGWACPASAVWLLLDLAGLFVVLLVVRAIFSFFPPFAGETQALIGEATEPFLRPWRRFNLRVERWDFTPAVAVLVLLVGREALRVLIVRFLEAVS